MPHCEWSVWDMLTLFGLLERSLDVHAAYSERASKLGFFLLLPVYSQLRVSPRQRFAGLGRGRVR